MRQKNFDQIDRFLEDLAILFSAYQMHHSPFESYVLFEKNVAINTSETDSSIIWKLVTFTRQNKTSVTCINKSYRNSACTTIELDLKEGDSKET